MSAYKHFSKLCSSFANLSLIRPSLNVTGHGNGIPNHSKVVCLAASGICTTPRNHDLMEFFDDKENWTEQRVKIGRAWKLDELRIKSNSDLHKLWFVLLKEKNMLLTMEQIYKERHKPMPSPERIYKVNESMQNIEKVVRERNKAYWELETGQYKEKTEDTYNGFGLPYKRKLREHTIPKEISLQHRKARVLKHKMVVDNDVINFLKLYNEKQEKKKYLMSSKLRYKHVCGLFRRFENIDEEALKAEFPDVDIEKAKRDKMSRGPRVNMY
ncbi:UNVERIFIED_CONTAM: hypothetical protein PYX00_004528 [Menopon gallinae]|uniref:Large ribosomal subunit protein uL29m n=1 Tax=Menopon gallinae TaxID=328185 RepID=A0AAW2I5P9_9NEOP